MVRRGDKNGLEEFCKNFTENEKWLHESDFFKPACGTTKDKYEMVATILELSSFGEKLVI